ncbi:SNX1 [Scenedesmus sp. PABB004]|nr:SNX1 [Scenedesmus sp. PABB004]
MGVEAAEPRVVSMLLDFMYSYVSGVLQDAGAFAEQVGRAPGEVEQADVALAVAARARHAFVPQPPIEVLRELADAVNERPLPPLADAEDRGYGLRTPANEHTLTQANWRINVAAAAAAEQGGAGGEHAHNGLASSGAGRAPAVAIRGRRRRRRPEPACLPPARQDPLQFGAEDAPLDAPPACANGGAPAAAAPPPGPPPPYEAVVSDAAGSHSMAAGPPAAAAPTAAPAPAPAPNGGAAAPAAGPSAFEITVADPVKQGEGVSAYVSYKVRTRTSLPQYNRPAAEVIRRFRDFAHLEAQLGERHRGAIVPPLPEKNAVQKFQMAGEFIEERRAALQVFLNRVAAHPVLSKSAELQLFLEATEDTWAVEMARAQVPRAPAARRARAPRRAAPRRAAPRRAAPRPPRAPRRAPQAAAAGAGAGGAGGPKKRLEDAVGWIKGLGAAASSIVGGGGRAVDAAEDPEYVKVRDYLLALESHLAEAHRQAARLTTKEAELGEATLEFGQALERLGRLEEGNVSEAFAQVSARAGELVAARRKGCEALGARFEAPLKEAVRSVRSATAVCNDRALALGAHLAAKQDLDAKKVRWAKLRGTPGSPPEKLAEAEREVSEAEARLRDSRVAYEELVAVMTEELNRWQKERAADMSALLRDFALAQRAGPGGHARARKAGGSRWMAPARARGAPAADSTRAPPAPDTVPAAAPAAAAAPALPPAASRTAAAPAAGSGAVAGAPAAPQPAQAARAAAAPQHGQQAHALRRLARAAAARAAPAAELAAALAVVQLCGAALFLLERCPAWADAAPGWVASAAGGAAAWLDAWWQEPGGPAGAPRQPGAAVAAAALADARRAVLAAAAAAVPDPSAGGPGAPLRSHQPAWLSDSESDEPDEEGRAADAAGGAAARTPRADRSARRAPAAQPPPARWARLRGTPGSPPEKLAEAEREAGPKRPLHGALAKMRPLARGGQARTFFDSADWQMAQEGKHAASALAPARDASQPAALVHWTAALSPEHAAPAAPSPGAQPLGVAAGGARRASRLSACT